MARLLVTGGAGFIGSNFIHAQLHHAGVPAKACCADHAHYAEAKPPQAPLEILNLDALTYAGILAHLHGVDKDARYRFVQADIADVASVDAAIRGFRPDAIVHFAAESHVDRSIDAGDVFVRTNVLGTQVLLDAARRHDINRFVHVSTDEVYGSILEGSFSEEDRLDPASPYSASKAGSDLLALAHHRTYGLNVSVTRCTNNYGPRQHPEKLLPKIITLARQDKPLPIYGDGLNVRDWLYVKDHCEAVATVLSHGKSGEVYNIAAQDERTNIDVTERVLTALGKPRSLITFVKDRPGHDRRYSIHDRKLRALGWRPRVAFTEGLQLTLDAFR